MSDIIKEAFERGFSRRLAETGLADQLDGRLRKQAIDHKTLLLFGLTAAPLALGAVTGRMHAAMNDITEDDIKEFKQRELIDEYKRQTRRLEIAARRKKLDKELYGRS